MEAFAESLPENPFVEDIEQRTLLHGVVLGK